MTISFTLVQGAYIVAGLLFILALAGLSKHESARLGNRFGIVGMTVALVFTILAAVLGVSLAGGAIQSEGTGAQGLLLIAIAMGIGAVIGIWRARKVEMTGMPELIAMLHSFVGLAAVLVGWNSSYEDSAYPVRPRRGGLRRGVHRSGDVHRVDRGLPQALGEDRLSPEDAAGPQRREPRDHRRVLRDDRRLRSDPAGRTGPAPVAARRHDGPGAAARLAPGVLDRRWRHAGRGVDAEQLLRLGGGRRGLPAEQRPADHHGRAGRLLGCLPVLHHVQGDEPLVHLGDRRRVRGRGRHDGRRRRLRRAPRGQRRAGRRAAHRGDVGHHHPGLRHGGGAGAARGGRAHPQAARRAASTCASGSTRSRAGCRGT